MANRTSSLRGKMKTKYTLEEFELIDELYEDQMPIKGIVEIVNQQIREGKTIRTENAIWYAIKKIYSENSPIDIAKGYYE
jgi:ATP-dependent RNA circularization protein (DNA/RNA ligase family)